MRLKLFNSLLFYSFLVFFIVKFIPLFSNHYLVFNAIVNLLALSFFLSYTLSFIAKRKDFSIFDNSTIILRLFIVAFIVLLAYPLVPTKDIVDKSLVNKIPSAISLIFALSLLIAIPIRYFLIFSSSISIAKKLLDSFLPFILLLCTLFLFIKFHSCF